MRPSQKDPASSTTVATSEAKLVGMPTVQATRGTVIVIQMTGRSVVRRTGRLGSETIARTTEAEAEAQAEVVDVARIVHAMIKTKNGKQSISKGSYF